MFMNCYFSWHIAMNLKTLSISFYRLKIDALNKILGREKAIVPETKLLSFLLCPYQGKWPKMTCVSGNCKRCADLLRPFTVKCYEHYFLNVKWFHWERREVEGKKKLDIHAYDGTVGDLIDQLSGDLECPTKGTTFVKHLFNAYWQQSQYELARDTLKQGQVLLLQDFAENRKATYAQEVKSAHFGKAQVSLHPTVCFYKNEEEQLVRHVAMFFSDDIGHDYHAVHCYTLKMVEQLRKETVVDEVILWSDGAASQYKGRGTFADLSLYPFPAQRNFFGSEHGKGEADGETGRFSQAMARAVAKGQCFRNAQDMCSFGQQNYESENLKKYSFILVGKEEIRRDRPETDVGTLPGTRSLHQLHKKKSYILAGRKLSCFCNACKEEKGLCENSEFVQPFEIYKMKPSKPVDAEVDEPNIPVPVPEEIEMRATSPVLTSFESTSIKHATLR
ncbi:(S)-beta-bisabolene synthase [Elysia marginata]|uniref:(S)-beta-bisabolene synthase n=1 Tax=Elysia marginata TaxID=1093978 RepID=A0AAV4FLN9_9GAST|nr:(S)-beta-bisabolene synthase [Elysia marginata]